MVELGALVPVAGLALFVSAIRPSDETFVDHSFL